MEKVNKNQLSPSVLKNSQFTIKDFNCWVCGSNKLEIAKSSNIESSVEKKYSLVNSDYGITGELHRCKNCGFVQWSMIDDNEVISLYEPLEDTSFDSICKARVIQQIKILKRIKKYRLSGKLLDVGAANGLFVSEAIKMGYHAEGLEPSEWFYRKAVEKNLPFHHGTLPHPNAAGPYDVITLIDVLEHVQNPVALLSKIHKIIAKDGILVVVVPDIESFPAKLLKWKWWNYKPGHIGYFNKKNLELAMKNAGFYLLNQGFRPSVNYPLDFILERINLYFPKKIRLPVPKILKGIIISLDLKDEIMGFYSPVQ